MRRGAAVLGLVLSGCAGSAAGTAAPDRPHEGAAATLHLTLDGLAPTTPTTTPAPLPAIGPATATRPPSTIAPVGVPTVPGSPRATTTWPVTVPPGTAAATPVTLVRPDPGAPLVLARGPGRRLETSCRSVVHIGDSTSVGMVSPLVLTNPGHRLDAQYARVGVTSVVVDALNGRSVNDGLSSSGAVGLSGYEAAVAARRSGFAGCWVIALGTNDAATVANGSTRGPTQRIDRMMSVIGDDPVLFVTVRTTTATGNFSPYFMAEWNAQLLAAASRYSNLRIYDWAAEADPSWFHPDGIHYTAVGYVERAARIADALAIAFPA